MVATVAADRTVRLWDVLTGGGGALRAPLHARDGLPSITWMPRRAPLKNSLLIAHVGIAEVLDAPPPKQPRRGCRTCSPSPRRRLSTTSAKRRISRDARYGRNC